MSNINYPTLRLGALKSLVQLKHDFETDEGILEAGRSPYEFEINEMLRDLFKVRVIEVVVEKEVIIDGGKRGPKAGGLSEEDQELVEDELVTLLKDLRELKMEDGGEDKDTQLKIMKAKATLIEQLVKLRERIFNIRRQAQFEGTVVGVLEDLVDESGRAEFLRRIGEFR